MESYLEERFGGVQAKNSSEEALRRWRRLCSVVKNPKRRFRFTANLDKRNEATAMKRKNHVRASFFSPPPLISAPCASPASAAPVPAPALADRSSNLNVHANVSAVLAKISSYLILLMPKI